MAAVLTTEVPVLLLVPLLACRSPPRLFRRSLLLRLAAAARLNPGRVVVELAGREQERGWLEAQIARFPNLAVECHGAYARERLSQHPVTGAHVMVSATRAQESHGLVLDEARLFGMPAVLPGAGAFVERALEGGCLLYEPQSVDSLAACLDELSRSPSELSLIHISEPTRPERISNALVC